MGPLLQFAHPCVLKWFCLALSCPQSKSAVDATKDVASGFKRVFGRLGVGARSSDFVICDCRSYSSQASRGACFKDHICTVLASQVWRPPQYRYLKMVIAAYYCRCEADVCLNSARRDSRWKEEHERQELEEASRL